MFKIDGKQNIYISQGDDATCEVSIINPEFPYNEYELEAGDYLVFTVRATPKQLGSSESPLIEKTLESKQIIIQAADTANLAVGQYFYDIRLYFADGSVNTIIPSTTGNHYNVIADLPSFYICEVV